MGKGRSFTMPKSYKEQLEYMSEILNRFVSEVRKKSTRYVRGDDGLQFPDVVNCQVTPELLKEWRTRLSRMVRKGMNLRQDKEIEIAAHAMLVWFLRMVAEEKWVEPNKEMW